MKNRHHKCHKNWINLDITNFQNHTIKQQQQKQQGQEQN